jgi:hypothetical protein
LSTEEQEVDLGRWWSALVARWWLPVLGLIVGAFVGYVISLGGKEVWKASTNIYLGASYSSVGGVLLQGPQGNPSTVGTIARAESTIQAAAAQAGMPASALRGNIATQSISSGAGSSLVRATGNPLVKITVQASTRRRAAAAANALAGFANGKIALLKTRIAGDEKELQTLLRGAAAGDPATRAVLAVQAGSLRDDQLQAKQLLIQARQIERPQVLTRAAAVKTTARSRRNSVVVAAFLGLVLGVIAALVWEPLARRARR